jgi:hypothetical protein
MKLNQDRLDEDFMIAKCKSIVKQTLEKNNFHEIWIPTETEQLSLEGRKRAEKEIRKELSENYTFGLDRIGIAYLAKKPKKLIIPSFLLGNKI